MMKKYVFDHFRAFFIAFNYANACASMCSLVKIHNSYDIIQLRLVEGVQATRPLSRDKNIEEDF